MTSLSVVTCPPVPLIPNSNKNTDLAVYGTIVSITCVYGFHFSDESLVKNLTCLDSGMWSEFVGDCVGKNGTAFIRFDTN
jgi:hypothetical protein